MAARGSAPPVWMRSRCDLDREISGPRSRREIACIASSLKIMRGGALSSTTAPPCRIRMSASPVGWRRIHTAAEPTASRWRLRRRRRAVRSVPLSSAELASVDWPSASMRAAARAASRSWRETSLPTTSCWFSSLEGSGERGASCGAADGSLRVSSWWTRRSTRRPTSSDVCGRLASSCGRNPARPVWREAASSSSCLRARRVPSSPALGGPPSVSAMATRERSAWRNRARSISRSRSSLLKPSELEARAPDEGAASSRMSVGARASRSSAKRRAASPVGIGIALGGSIARRSGHCRLRMPHRSPTHGRGPPPS